MKILSTRKLLRTTRCSDMGIRSPFVRHTPLEYRTHNFPPSIHLSENVKHRGYFPGCLPPLSVSPPTALGQTWHRYLSCHASICICLHCIHCFLPSSLRQTTRPTLLLPSSTTELTTPPSCQSYQASPPFDHQISPTLLYTACIRVVQYVTAFS